MVEANVAEGFPHLDFDRVVTYTTMKHLIEQGSVIFRVLKHDQKIIGYYVCEAINYYFTTGAYMTMYYIYVIPKFRGTRAYLMLMKDFEHWATINKMRELMVGVDSGINVDKLEKGFKKLGYTFVGSYYKKYM